MSAMCYTLWKLSRWKWVSFRLHHTIDTRKCLVLFLISLLRAIQTCINFSIYALQRVDFKISKNLPVWQICLRLIWLSLYAQVFKLIIYRDGNVIHLKPFSYAYITWVEGIVFVSHTTSKFKMKHKFILAWEDVTKQLMTVYLWHVSRVSLYVSI